MAKAKATKYDEYVNLLENITQRLKQDREQSDKRIELYENILCIVKDKQAGKKIAKSRYKKIVACSCPDFGMIAALEGVPVTSPAELAELMPYCGQIEDCCECWEQYIDEIIDTIGEGNVSVKNTSPLPSPTDTEKEEP